MKKQNTQGLEIGFVFLTAIIFLIGYFIYASVMNVFQAYAHQFHLNSEEFPSLNLKGSRIGVLLLCLGLIQGLQPLQRQFYLMLILLLSLSLLLFFSVSLTTFPYIAALSAVLFDFSQPWRHVYVKSSIRATVEGAIIGLSGLAAILATAIEGSWVEKLSQYQYPAMILFLSLIVFGFLTKKLLNQTNTEVAQNPISIWHLIKNNPFIFIACFFAGINLGIFNIAYTLSQEILPNSPPDIYQYTLIISSILGPIFLGIIADKKGVVPVVLVLSLMMVLCKFINFSLFTLQISNPIFYDVVVFFEGALAATVLALSIALVGEHLRSQSVFRAFALSNIFCFAGITVCSRIFALFPNSFGSYSLGMGIVNLILFGLLGYFSFKVRFSKLIS